MQIVNYNTFHSYNWYVVIIIRSCIATLLCISCLVMGVYLPLNPNMWVLLHAWLKFETMAIAEMRN